MLEEHMVVHTHFCIHRKTDACTALLDCFCSGIAEKLQALSGCARLLFD